MRISALYAKMTLPAMLLSTLWLSTTTEAFVPLHHPTVVPKPTSSSSSRIFMSDVPQEKTPNSKPGGDNNDNDAPVWMNDLFVTYAKPPPPPEDLFVMGGDLISLCVYGITDHFFCQVVSRMMVRDTLADPLHSLSRAAASQVSNYGVAVEHHSALPSPVWLDLNAPWTNQVLEANLSNKLITQYSPLLEPMGQATCILIFCWLVAGWFHQAFLFRNTLDCSTERALTVTAKTWLTTCGLLFGSVLVSQAMCGCDHFYLVQRGDLDYIIDSSSVLVLWRFLASYLLGSGRDDA